MLLTANLFPLMCFGIASVLNTVAISYHSLAAVPFGSIVVVLLIWILVSCPLCLFGTVRICSPCCSLWTAACLLCCCPCIASSCQACDQASLNSGLINDTSAFCQPFNACIVVFPVMLGRLENQRVSCYRGFSSATISTRAMGVAWVHVAWAPSTEGLTPVQTCMLDRGVS